MKKVIIKLFSLILLMFSGCQKKVTDLAPIDRITTDLAFSTPARIEAAVVGSYDGLQSAEFLSGRALIYADLLGEDAIDKNSFFGTLPKFDQLGSAGVPANVWNAAYNSIGRANRAIAGVNANAAILNDAAKQKNFVAEAKFIRAIAHFYLVNFFAQSYNFTADASHPGIPIITDSYTSNDPAANKPRSTVAAVYTAVIADLSDGLIDLPTTYSTAALRKSRATKGAAAALSSRVYLYKGDYTNAKLIAGKIINGDYGAYSLNPKPDSVFGPGNYTTPETIFSIPNSVNDNPNTNNALPQHYFETGRGDIAVSPTFINASTNPYFAADDKRRALIAANTLPANAGWFFTKKYPDVATRADWAPIIRYAEVLLNYAEASAQLAAGVDADAVAKLNLVRDRSRVSASQYTVASFASKTELINAILAERRIELAFEGHRYFDLARTKSNVTNKLDSDRVTPISINYGANKFIFPIPQAEVDKSSGVLIQNTGY